MAVLINFKICDNAPECGGIEVCPTGALSYSEDDKSILIDNDKCISCGACESECPIGAIRVAYSDEEYNKISKEIEDDSRTTKDLFVDRYGAAALSSFFKIDDTEIDDKINKDNITLIEFYKNDEAECLLKSIPVKELTEDFDNDTLYYKIDTSDDLANKYNVSETPSLVVYKSGNKLGEVIGYYTLDDIEEVKEELNKKKEA